MTEKIVAGVKYGFLLATFICGVNAAASTFELRPTLSWEPVDLPLQTHLPGVFCDRYNFTIGAVPGDLGGGIFFNLDLDLPSSALRDYSITDLRAGLYHQSGIAILDDADVSGFAYSVSAGRYFALVTGAANGRLGGRYQVAYALRDADISPLPLPDAAWLFGAGLLGFFPFVGRKYRRTQQDARALSEWRL
jgi:hypothetical protein